MNITREIVTKRLEILITNREKMQANLNALSGAIDDCEYWLSILDVQEAEDKGE
jgi:hypothetical protein